MALAIPRRHRVREDAQHLAQHLSVGVVVVRKRRTK
jgi:hypothetical protein